VQKEGTNVTASLHGCFSPPFTHSPFGKRFGPLCNNLQFEVLEISLCIAYVIQNILGRRRWKKGRKGDKLESLDQVVCNAQNVL